MKTVNEVFSPEETFALGKTFGNAAKQGEVYAFYGDLGVGKTVFIKGFAAGLGVTEDVVSPTFTIIQEYGSGRLPMYHFDVYRIDDPDELFEIGFEEYVYGEGVTLVEWAEKAEEFLPKDRIMIRIEKDFEKGADYRKITVETPEEYGEGGREADDPRN